MDTSMINDGMSFEEMLDASKLSEQEKESRAL